jgi:Hypothetical glycosyl hydrolase 6
VRTKRPGSAGGWLSRRDFLVLSAAGGALAPRGRLLAAESAPWHAAMRRCGQINFNERDPLTLDAEAWVDYFASLKVDALLMGGGGIVAFYPTEVPYHHRSEFLGARDLFGDVAGAARRRGMRVVARMDCNYAYEEALRAGRSGSSGTATARPARTASPPGSSRRACSAPTSPSR